MAKNPSCLPQHAGADGARRLAEIVLRAAALETPHRDQYLRDATGGDPALLAEARRRLQSARTLGSSFLARPAGRLLDTPAPAGSGAPGAALLRRFPSGTILGGRFRIVSFLGRGGMGAVYRADDLRLGEPVALKLLAPELEGDPETRDRLLEETRIARKISHPNVCRVHDAGEAEGLTYLSMEFVDGEDLSSLLRRIGRLPKRKAREIGLETCAGLAAAHRLGILHRDLKPSNLMLDGAGRTRITDFGLASFVGAPEGSGSPAYMAPERWQGDGATAAGDLYALGLVLYELFTGRTAFCGESVAELWRFHQEVRPMPPGRWVPGFDPELEHWILRCLEKDPERRPSSVEEVARALERISPAGGARLGVGGGSGLGWRPESGAEIPGRPHWRALEKIGEGGFGDVWRVGHYKTGEERVFKFCYEARSLRSLKRETTLFRLLKEELGERDDIARILDWSFDEPPYYVESEYTAGGNLLEWAKTKGGIDRVPLETRLEILAQVADALAAAHSVGVLHKDVKPANVLVIEGPDGRPRVRLTDFGIGVLLDRERLAGVDFTVEGMTETAGGAPSPDAGTRLYLAPELVEGRAPTVQADVYSLGVFLYQLVVGDLSRALAPGWRREIDDELLRADVVEAVEGAPERRLGDARLLAERLRTLEKRRVALVAERRRERRAERARRRWRLLGAVAAVLALVAGALVFHAERTAREARRANHEAEAARQVSEFLIELFEVSSPSEARGSTVTAREILDRGAERIRHDLGDRPLARARLLETIGTVYVKLGLYDRAAPLLDEALETRRRLLGVGHPDVAASLAREAELAAALSRFEEAEDLYRRALAIQRPALGPAHPAVVESLGGLGAVYLRLGRHAEAQATYRRALEITEETLGPRHPSLVPLLDPLARSLREAGRFAEAEPLFWRALRIGEETLGSNHPQVATVLTNLGDLYRFQDRYREAGAHYWRSLEIKEEVFGPDHPEVATTLNSYGQILEHQGRFDEAEAYFLRARAISEKARDPRIGYALNNLGDLYRRQGRYAEAETLLRQALELAEAGLPLDHRLIAYPLLSLANIYRDQERYAEAEPLYERVLTIRENALPAGHLRLVEAREDYAAFLRAAGRAAAVEGPEATARSSLEVPRSP